jgi:hypothetical protein
MMVRVRDMDHPPWIRQWFGDLIAAQHGFRLLRM